MLLKETMSCLADARPLRFFRASRVLFSTLPPRDCFVRQHRHRRRWSCQQNHQKNRIFYPRFCPSYTQRLALSSRCFYTTSAVLRRLGVGIDHSRNNNRSRVTRYFSSKQGGVCTEVETHGDNTVDPPLVIFSSVTETPLDSTVMEKPYTVILMEDDALTSSFFETDESAAESSLPAISSSWRGIFGSKIPRDFGMSFASISLQMTRKPKSAGRVITETAPISKVLDALKASNLPTMADALLVARGPCSSLVAQYYLESFPLKGLIMIDPILFGENPREYHKNGEEQALCSLASKLKQVVYPDDPDSLDRFRSQRLLVEPNAVPMMVVRTIIADGQLVEYNAAWRSCSQHVADRHGDPDGPYGIVPVVDLASSSTTTSRPASADSEDAFATMLLDHMNQWIEEDLP